MNNGINLLVEKHNANLLAPVKSPLKIFRFGAMGILFAVGVSSVILSILIVLSPLPQLARDEQKARANLAAFQVGMIKLAFINERGDSIREIIAKRPSYDKKIDLIKSKMPTGVSLDGITITKKRYNFKFSSTNLESLNKLIDGIVAITGSGHDFFRVYLTSLAAEEEAKKFILIVDLATI